MGRRPGLVLARSGPLAAALALALFAAAPAQAQTRASLRVCADPDNLPFSSSRPGDEGLYLEFAALMARDLGLAREVFWWRTNFGKRALRLTLLAKRCDLHLGLPDRKGFMGRRVALTKPFLTTGYAIVVPKEMPFEGLADLRGKTVGVLFNTPPQNLLAEQAEIAMATFQDPDKVMAELGRGAIDAAFIWGPSAGYYNKTRLRGAYRVIPTAGPRLAWRVTIGVRGEDRALRDLLDGEIERLSGALEGLKAKYGFPDGEPLVLDWLPDPNAPPRRGAVEPEVEPEVKNARLEAPAAAPQARAPGPAGPAGPEAIQRGRRLFNGGLGCAHCHGPNAVSAERRRDLRRLEARHGDKAGAVYRQAVLKGRAAKGMPAWEGKIREEELATVKLYLDSIQLE